MRLYPFIWMVGFLGFVASAAAGPLDPRETRARADCLSGKYESGVALLADLFTETGNSNFIYNQARCYEQNNRPEEAINRFREYLRVARGISAEDQSDAERHIAECQQFVIEQDSIRRRAAETTSPSGEGASGGASEAASKGASEGPGEGPREGGRRLRITGALAGGVGVLAVATGGILSLFVRSTQGQVESDARKGTYDPSLDSRGRTYNTLQWVSYGVGAGLVALGGTLYGFGHAAGKREARVSVAVEPAVAPGLGALAVKGRF